MPLVDVQHELILFYCQLRYFDVRLTPLQKNTSKVQKNLQNMLEFQIIFPGRLNPRTTNYGHGDLGLRTHLQTLMLIPFQMIVLDMTAVQNGIADRCQNIHVIDWATDANCTRSIDMYN